LGAFDGYAGVVGLFLRELGQLHADAFEVQAGNLFVEMLDTVKNSSFKVPVGPDDDENVRASGVAFSPDGNLLAGERSWPGSVVLWDWQKAKELIWMNPNCECLDGVVILPDSKTVAVAKRSMSGPPLLLWDVSEVVKSE
jgi:WD40 repeat protein